MRSSSWTRIAIVAAIVGVALGVGASASGKQSKPAGSKDLVLFTMTSTNVYGANQIKGAQREAKRLGYNPKVYENMFSQPQPGQQGQEFPAGGAKPAPGHLLPGNPAPGNNHRAALARVAP